MSIEKHPTRSGWYYVKHYPQGRSGKVERIPIEGYGPAQAVDNRLKAAKGTTPTTTATHPRLAAILDDYLLWVEQNQAAATYRHKRDRLPKFIIPALGHYRVQDLSQRILDQYGQQMTRPMYRADLIHIMALIRWMVKRQYAAPLTWKPELPTVVSKIKPLPDTAGILATIAAIPYESVRMLFTLQLYTGLRPNEIKRLTWENYQEDAFILAETKTKQPQLIPIPEHLQPWFNDHKKQQGWVFESIKKKGSCWSNLHGILAAAAKKTGQHLSPHMLRHASAIYLLEATGDIYQVASHLRHSRVTTSEIYLRRTATKKRAAVESIVDYVNPTE